jgi:FkbM family methyltransferase
VYFDTFTEASVVADVGCGYEAEFSRHMLDQHGLRAVGVDPTRKHAPFLRELEGSSQGRFRHLPVAVSRENGVLTFHESRQNESGSLLATHTNVQRDDTNDYEVESVSLPELTRRLGGGSVDFLKLDLEGAEYDLFERVSEEDLRPFGQIFLEFHHHCTDHTVAETKEVVDRISRNGFKVFTLDRHNYLFYR